jgi:hypothetical protein
MQVNVIEIGEALNNNTEKVRGSKTMCSTKRLPVLLVSEMGVEEKQHRTP